MAVAEFAGGSLMTRLLFAAITGLMVIACTTQGSGAPPADDGGSTDYSPPQENAPAYESDDYLGTESESDSGYDSSFDFDYDPGSDSGTYGDDLSGDRCVELRFELALRGYLLPSDELYADIYCGGLGDGATSEGASSGSDYAEGCNPAPWATFDDFRCGTAGGDEYTEDCNPAPWATFDDFRCGTAGGDEYTEDCNPAPWATFDDFRCGSTTDSGLDRGYDY